MNALKKIVTLRCWINFWIHNDYYMFQSLLISSQAARHTSFKVYYQVQKSKQSCWKNKKKQYEQMCSPENNEKEIKFKIHIGFVKIALLSFVIFFEPERNHLLHQKKIHRYSVLQQNEMAKKANRNNKISVVTIQLSRIINHTRDMSWKYSNWVKKEIPATTERQIDQKPHTNLYT